MANDAPPLADPVTLTTSPGRCSTLALIVSPLAVLDSELSVIAVPPLRTDAASSGDEGAGLGEALITSRVLLVRMDEWNWTAAISFLNCDDADPQSCRSR